MATCRNSNIAPRAFQDGEEEMDSIVSTAVGSTARGIMWEAKQARAMLQSLLIIVSGWAFIEGTNLARSGSSSELSFRANISRKRKSCGLTEYQFLRVNHFVILSLPKIPHLRRTPARSLQTVCSSLTPACLSSHLLARSPSSSPPPPASTCEKLTFVKSRIFSGKHLIYNSA